MSVQGKLYTLRVDIVDSEDKSNSARRRPAKGKRPINLEQLVCPPPAFMCDGFSVCIGIKNVIDFDRSRGGEGLNELRPSSLRLLRLSVSHMESKPLTTNINVSFACNAITQHVNMSLLRLVHQFVTMIKNIHETRLELEGTKETMNFKTHKKQDSSSGTESQMDDQDKVPKQAAIPDLDISQADITCSDHNTDDTLHEIKGSPLIGSGVRRFSLKRPKLELIGGQTVSSEDGPSVVPSVTVQSPQSLNWSDSAVVEIPDTSSPALAEKSIIDEINDSTPKCWKTLYHLVDLYSTMPETKTVLKKTAPSRLSVIDEEPEKGQ